MNYIFISLILITSLIAKQEDFSIIIDEPFNNALLDVTQNYDRTVTAVGFVKKFKTNTAKSGTTYSDPFNYLASLSNEYGSQIHLIKVGENVDILQRKSTKLTDFADPVSIIKTPSDGYFVGGHTHDGLLILLKMDSNNNILFSKKFGTSNQNNLSNIINLRDGGVLAVGTSYTSRSGNNNIFETGLGLKDIYLTRFTKDGIQLWSKKYGTEYDDNGIDAVEADDGSIVVIGQTHYDSYKNVILMRTNEHGDKIWLEHYKNDKVTTPHKIIRLKDGKFLASLSEENDMRLEQIRLLKFDLQGNILKDKEIFTSYSSILKDIKEYSNSNIIGVGNVKDKFNTDALAMLFDSELNMLAQEHFGEENYDSFNKVAILHDSKAFAVGINTDAASQESNMWLVKLNSDISIAQTSAKSVNFYEELSEIFKYEISAHKLLIKEDLSIDFIDKDLYFNTGQYKLNEIQKKFLSGFSSKLLPFLYKNRDAIDTIEIDGHTSSEWAGVDFTDSYLNNEKLSMNRSFYTLSHMYKSQDEHIQQWLTSVIKGSGLNFSKKIILDDVENKQRSRRVSFKLILRK